MGDQDALHYWEIWYPQSAATGILIARGQIDPTTSLWFHAAPPILTAEVSDAHGQRVAWGQNLAQTAETPMCRLTVQSGQITRQDLWPTQADLGSVVLLPGGEAGILKSWWNAADQKEWRWSVEFFNKQR